MPVMQSEIVDRAGEFVHVLFIVDIAVIVTMAMRVLAIISGITRFIANETHINSQVLFLVTALCNAACSHPLRAIARRLNIVQIELRDDHD